VLVEISPPAEHAAVAFLYAQRQGLTGAETGPCPTCGEELLAELDDQPCPACAEGALRLVGEYEP
jgi:hypothetical protein